MIVDADEIASDRKAYLYKVERGETIVIAVRNRPVAELRPAATPDATRRPSGLCRGEFIVPDDFDAPLPAEILADFEVR